MLTGFGSEEMAVQALHEGAIDYIPKDSFSKDSIWGLIKAALETWKRKRAEEELRRKNIELRRYGLLQENANRYTHELSPDTTYYFVVNNTDQSGNTAESSEYRFKYDW